MGGSKEGSGMGKGGWHPLNQRGEKLKRDRRSAFRTMDDAVGVELREKRIKRSEEEFEEEYVALEGEERVLALLGRTQFQLNRALKHVFEEKAATPQEMMYIDRQGQESDYYITKKGNQVTIVNFPPPVV